MEVHKVEVVSKKQLTSKIYELNVRLVNSSNLEFKAGQCVGFHVLPETDGLDLQTKEKRLYSLTSLPEHGNELSFCVDVTPMGPGSQLVLDAKEGTQFNLEGPYGGFIVSDKTRDLLFLATGAGIAPFRSMIKDLLKSGFDKKITLLFGLRNEDDIFYHDEFSKLSEEYSNFTFIPMLSQPKGDWKGETGRITKYIEENSSKFTGYLAYICGSPEMIKDTRSLLISKGWGVRDIKIEIFH
jgi:ferredoxin-NADP reductase